MGRTIETGRADCVFDSASACNEVRRHPVHDVQGLGLCHENGIAAPLTKSMLELPIKEWSEMKRRIAVIQKEFGAPDEMKLRTAISLKLSYKKSYYAVFGAFARVRSFRN